MWAARVLLPALLLLPHARAAAVVLSPARFSGVTFPVMTQFYYYTQALESGVNGTTFNLTLVSDDALCVLTKGSLPSANTIVIVSDTSRCCRDTAAQQVGRAGGKGLIMYSSDKDPGVGYFQACAPASIVPSLLVPVLGIRASPMWSGLLDAMAQSARNARWVLHRRQRHGERARHVLGCRRAPGTVRAALAPARRALTLRG
jgi:hypothetical protein